MERPEDNTKPLVAECLSALTWGTEMVNETLKTAFVGGLEHPFFASIHLPQLHLSEHLK